MWHSFYIQKTFSASIYGFRGNKKKGSELSKIARNVCIPNLFF
jgi:hypothetical protein